MVERDINLEENGVVLDVGKGVEKLEIEETLDTERGIAFTDRSSKELQVLSTHIGLDNMEDMSCASELRRLIDEREGDGVCEWPCEQCVVLAATDAHEHRDRLPLH